MNTLTNQTEKSADDLIRWEKQAYGMTAAQLDRQIESQSFSGLELLYGMGLLSDCQELIAQDDGENSETLRQWINQVKYIVTEHMDKRGIR
jgi:hypothetical protein